MSPASNRSRFFEKARMIPHRLIHPEPDEPAEQQVELEPLHQLALRADRVKKACNSIARSSISGAIEGRPIPE